jgi:hypothetical protein
VKIRKVEIVDCVQSSRFRKLLCQHLKSTDQLIDRDMVSFRLTAINPRLNPTSEISSQELRVEFALLPLKINAGAWSFLVSFMICNPITVDLMCRSRHRGIPYSFWD